MQGNMKKYVPHLRELLPSVPFLSPVYGASEGTFGVQSSLVDWWAATHPEVAAEVAGAPNGAAGGGSAADAGSTFTGPAFKAAGGAGTAAGAAAADVAGYADFVREADGESSYILLPHGGKCTECRQTRYNHLLLCRSAAVPMRRWQLCLQRE